MGICLLVIFCYQKAEPLIAADGRQIEAVYTQGEPLQLRFGKDLFAKGRKRPVCKSLSSRLLSEQYAADAPRFLDRVDIAKLHRADGNFVFVCHENRNAVLGRLTYELLLRQGMMRMRRKTCFWKLKSRSKREPGDRQSAWKSRQLRTDGC